MFLSAIYALMHLHGYDPSLFLPCVCRHNHIELMTNIISVNHLVLKTIWNESSELIKREIIIKGSKARVFPLTEACC